DQRSRYIGKLAKINRKAALINNEILPFDEAVSPQFVQECHVLWCFTRIGGHECRVIRSTQPLSRGGKRRKERTPAEQRDERAALHLGANSITSSARASSVGGMSRPSALAVLRLTANSNFVGSITGRSPGYSPLRMRPA